MERVLRKAALEVWASKDMVGLELIVTSNRRLNARLIPRCNGDSTLCRTIKSSEPQGKNNATAIGNCVVVSGGGY